MGQERMDSPLKAELRALLRHLRHFHRWHITKENFWMLAFIHGPMTDGDEG